MSGQDSRRACAVAAASFVAMLVTVGVAFSYGAFVEPLRADLGAGQGAAAGVFSVTSACFFGLGAVSGPAADRWGPRPVLLVGAAAFAGGLLLTAAAPALWVVYLGHGLGVGCAAACSFVPLVAAVSGWFTRYRTIAVGVAVSGIGVGTLIVAPVAAALIHGHGWRTTYAGIAVVGGVALAAAALALRPAPAVERAGSDSLGEALRTSDYRALYVGQLLLAAAMFVPFVHLPAFAETRGLGHVAAAGLVGLIGATSLVGRLALGPVAESVGLLRTYRLCFLAMGGSFVLWLVPGGAGPLVVFSVVFGLGYGGFVTLGPGVLSERFGVQRLGGLLGLLYTSSALGSGAGPYLAGVLIEHRGYRPAVLVALVLGLAATLTLMKLRPVVEPAGRGRGSVAGSTRSDPRARSGADHHRADG